MEVGQTELSGDLVAALRVAGVAFLLTLIAGHYWVRWLATTPFGRPGGAAESAHQGSPTGIPTLGGLLIAASVVVMTLLVQPLGGPLLLPVAVVIAYALLGACDDVLSMRAAARSLGGPAWLTLGGHLGIALLAALGLYLPPPYGLHQPTLVQLPFVGGWNLGAWALPLALLIIVATAQAVTLTDGPDGLASWLLVVAFAAYGVVTLLCAPQLRVLSPFCFTLVGACAAFAWYNAAPAQLGLGASGALALGAALAMVALLTQQWLLLPIIGAVFVLEVAVLLPSRYGARPWRDAGGREQRAPLHQHLERAGWSAMQVMQRLVLLGLIAALVGIALALVTGEAPG